jgi:hypothetical protein
MVGRSVINRLLMFVDAPVFLTAAWLAVAVTTIPDISFAFSSSISSTKLF